MSRHPLAALALAGSLILPAAAALADGDAAKGQRLFRQCQACHVADREQNRVGPHLVGLFGRRAGTVEGFNYSPAMRDSGIVWDEATLDAYLRDPRGYLPGNRMTFAGLRREDDREDVIAYLKQATKKE